MDASSSSVSRYRPAVILLTSLAAAGSIWYLYQSRQAGTSNNNDATGLAPQLQRRGALRRRGNLPVRNRLEREAQAADEPLIIRDEQLDANSDGRSPTFVHYERDENGALSAQSRTGRQTPLTVPSRHDEDETELSVSSEASTREAERLKELAYTIARHNHEREGIEHHGVTCDNCHMVPIVGPRFHCANCPDFDLCEQCEATDCHLRTHVFFKVKIPAPWGGKDPLPLWYPGKPARLPRSIDTQEHRAARAELSLETGFPVTKIDGFYQQFTCMANVPFEDFKGLHMAIDRASFDHCFLQQVMTGKKLGLVADRLFGLYDENKDGVIDFWEFVRAMSLIHGKTPGAKTRRVFKGLDLDDDGFVSRRDFIKMFRSFYDLNNEVLYGYLKAERIGENAELIGTSRDVEAHLAGGRSLAAYFGDSLPSWEVTPGWEGQDRADEKFVNVFGDHTMIDSERPAVLKEYDETDLMLSDDSIERNDHLTEFYVFHDEMLRVACGAPLRFMHPDKVRIFVDDNYARMREADGSPWVVNFDWIRRKSIYLRVEPEELEGHAGWRDKMSDEEFCKDIYAFVKIRICVYDLPDTIKTQGLERVELNRMHKQFMMDTADSSKRSKAVDNSTTIQDDKISQPLSAKTTNSTHHRNTFQDYVGGTAASHTITRVVTSALNDLLNPIFMVPERLALEAAATSSARKEFSAEINSHMLKLYKERWVDCSIIFKSEYVPSGTGLSAKSRYRLIEDLKERILTEGVSHIPQALVEGFAQLASGEYGRLQGVPLGMLNMSKVGSEFLKWTLWLEAEVWAEEVLKDEKQKREAIQEKRRRRKKRVFRLVHGIVVVGDIPIEEDDTERTPRRSSGRNATSDAGPTSDVSIPPTTTEDSSSPSRPSNSEVQQESSPQTRSLPATSSSDPEISAPVQPAPDSPDNNYEPSESASGSVDNSPPSSLTSSATSPVPHQPQPSTLSTTLPTPPPHNLSDLFIQYEHERRRKQKSNVERKSSPPSPLSTKITNLPSSEPNPDRIHHLTIFKSVADTIKSQSSEPQNDEEEDEEEPNDDLITAGGKIDLETFERLIDGTPSDHASGEINITGLGGNGNRKVLDWVRGWVDLIIF